MKRRLNPHTGSTFDSFLKEERILADAEAVAAKRVLAWQLEEAMMANGVNKQSLARELKTSRSQVDRLLDPMNTAVSIASVSKAAKVLGRRVEIRVVPTRRISTRKTIVAVRAKSTRKIAAAG